MQLVRTFVWIVITALLVAFVAMNWVRAPVNIWPVQEGYLHFEWPVGVIAILFFLLGLIPMWLLSKAGKWRLNRRISSLENTMRASAPPPPLATSTQLESGASQTPPSA